MLILAAQEPTSDKAYRTSVDSAAPDEWEQIVGSFDDGVFEQTWSYGAACWGAENLSHVVLRLGGDVVAACQVVLFRPPLISGGIAHVKFGPLWRRGHEAKPEHLRQMLTSLRDEYVHARRMFLRIMPPAFAGPSILEPNPLSSVGCSQTRIADDERFVANLSRPVDELRAGFKSKWRYHLKKAEQENLTVTQGIAARRLDAFLDLNGAMHDQKTFADPRALDRLPKICADLPQELKLDIWLCSHGEDHVAGAVVSRIGDTAYYLFGASNRQGRDLRAGYLLHWSIMNQLQQEGCRWYDLGGDCGNQGLRQFKSGLVGKTGATPRLPGCFDLSPGALSSVVARSLFGLRDFLGEIRGRMSRTGT